MYIKQAQVFFLIYSSLKKPFKTVQQFVKTLCSYFEVFEILEVLEFIDPLLLYNKLHEGTLKINKGFKSSKCFFNDQEYPFHFHFGMSCFCRFLNLVINHFSRYSIRVYDCLEKTMRRYRYLFRIIFNNLIDVFGYKSSFVFEVHTLRNTYILRPFCRTGNIVAHIFQITTKISLPTYVLKCK